MIIIQAEDVQKVTLIPGDGVGPEIMASVKDVTSASGAPIKFEEFFLRLYNANVIFR